MTEKIFEILQKNIHDVYVEDEVSASDDPRIIKKFHNELRGLDISSKEIAEMMKEFIEWITWTSQITVFQCNNNQYWRDVNDNEYSLDKIFNYWLENIYKK